LALKVLKGSLGSQEVFYCYDNIRGSLLEQVEEEYLMGSRLNK